MRFLPAVATAMVVLAAAGWSQSTKSDDDADAALKTNLPNGKLAVAPNRQPNLAGSRTLFPSYFSSSSEYWVNVPLQANSTIDLDSGLNFTDADSVRVTVRCSNGSLADVVLSAYWTVPGAPYFNIADLVQGDTFPFRNVGGASFPSYGSQFRLRITNNGATGVTLSQVLMFARRLYQ